MGYSRVMLCPTCGKQNTVTRPASQGYCDRKCAYEALRRSHIGRKHSAAEKEKRVVSRKAFYAENPDAQAKRIKNAVAATRTQEYRAAARERYDAMLENGTGICSQEVKAFTAERAKWVLKNARHELSENEEFVSLWTETRKRIVSELPYDGGDYVEYCREVGQLMTADPMVRQFQDLFFKESIPRWSKAYDAPNASTAPTRQQGQPDRQG